MERLLVREVRPKRGWQSVFGFLTVGIWFVVLLAMLHGFAIRNPARGLAMPLGMISIVLGTFLGTVYQALKASIYVETVSVDSDKLRIVGKISSFVLTDRTFENTSVSDLRYETWSAGRGVMQNGIWFSYGGKTIKFARDAGPDAAYDLIDAMCTVYPFAQRKRPDPPGVVNW